MIIDLSRTSLKMTRKRGVNHHMDNNDVTWDGLSGTYGITCTAGQMYLTQAISPVLQIIFADYPNSTADLHYTNWMMPLRW
jgi:hypothetical protein